LGAGGPALRAGPMDSAVEILAANPSPLAGIHNDPAVAARRTLWNSENPQNVISRKRLQRSPRSWEKATSATERGVGCRHSPMSLMVFRREDLAAYAVEPFRHSGLPGSGGALPGPRHNRSARRYGHTSARDGPHVQSRAQPPTGSRGRAQVCPGYPCTGNYSPSTIQRPAFQPSTGRRGSTPAVPASTAAS
jgi:hypothetical protein